MGQDQDMWDRIRICGTGSGYVGQDQDMWNRIRIDGLGESERQSGDR